MNQHADFTVYTASAGSGKTYTLVRDYLLLLFTHRDDKYFRHILAITFTNKAAREMKDRIIGYLKKFQEGAEDSMLSDIAQSSGLSEKEIRTRSARILDSIFRYYSELHITTIDSFTHKIIRTFSRDFHLRPDFEVSMETDIVLQKSINNVLESLGEDRGLTEIITKFVLELVKNDKAWNVERDLFEFSKKLENEKHKRELLPYLQRDTADFIRLQDKLQKKYYSLREQILSLARKTVNVVEQQQLENFFDRKSFSNFFKKILNDLDKSINEEFKEPRIKNRIEKKNILKKIGKERLGEDAPVIREMIAHYEQIMSYAGTMKLLYLLLKSIPMTAVLSRIYRSMLQLLKDENSMLIGEFNEMIFNNLKEQPSAYIFERLGLHFRHYFIDEMQDTSVLQWKNMEHLVEEALASKNTVMLVGDAKQSLYRWRGGEPEQFMYLTDPEIKPDYVERKDVIELNKNYRSLPEIVHFNNDFFQFAAQKLLTDREYLNLYENHLRQEPVKPEGGYVEIRIINKEETKTNMESYVEHLLLTVDDVLQEYSPGEICILTGRNDTAGSLAGALLDAGYPVVSGDHLKNALDERIDFIIHLLRSLIYPGEKAYRMPALYFLYGHLDIKEPLHHFLDRFSDYDERSFYAALSKEGIEFNPSYFRSLPLYESMEYLIDRFRLDPQADAFISSFLENVFTFSQRKGNGREDFLLYWEERQDSFITAMDELPDSIRVMTVHKSKGLEFPVVIYCDNEDFNKLNAYDWLHPEDENLFDDFESFLVHVSSGLSYMGEAARGLYEHVKSQNVFDRLNVLYVAFTRASEQLYILSAESGKKSSLNFTEIIRQYLQSKNLWIDGENLYSYGSKKRLQKSPETVSKDTGKLLEPTAFQAYLDRYELPAEVKLWGSQAEKAITEGDRIHYLLSHLQTNSDLPRVMEMYRQMYPENQSKGENTFRKMLENILNHDRLKAYYAPGVKVYNERPVSDLDGNIFIPDRLVQISDGQWVIIDYKTGEKEDRHYRQVDEYRRVLEESGRSVHESMLVYLRDNQIEVEIV